MAKKDKNSLYSGNHSVKTNGRGIGVAFRWVGTHLYLVSFLICLAAFAYWLYAPFWGNTIGNTTGTLVGLAKGSFEGITKGLKEGAEAGKETALSAEDTVVQIGTTLRETQNLQVLQVNFKLSDVYEEGKKYATLFTLPCTGVFTVDLKQSKAVLQNDESLLIIIPKPEFTPYFDESKITTLAEYPSGSTSRGSADDGYAAFINSLDQLKQNVRTEMTGYDTLAVQAEQVALEQVEQLARSVCGTSRAVEVQFAEEGGD